MPVERTFKRAPHNAASSVLIVKMNQSSVHTGIVTVSGLMHANNFAWLTGRESFYCFPALIFSLGSRSIGGSTLAAVMASTDWRAQRLISTAFHDGSVAPNSS